MLVLSTSHAELRYFPEPEDVPGGYAILSHVWDKSEESFKDIQRIGKRCEEDGSNPRDFVSRKIRECCKLAESHGYEWIWNDTCCIDKASSTELSEAINSMFRYYSFAKVCYAYLGDVPGDDDPRADDSAFRKSGWHKRGWTLQELIAPELLIFVSQDWRVLGGRTELADVLEEITKIPARLLRLETKMGDYCIAQRMSWAAGRKTTRVEDRAYSLLGIFGIHMPTLYGEGSNAFRRLQEEIMRQSIDPSLFLWDKTHLLADEIIEATPSSSSCAHHGNRDSYLLATSPDTFSDCSNVVFLPFHVTGATDSRIEKPESQVTFADVLSERLPTFTLTSYGAHGHVPVVPRSDGVLVAILPCFRRGNPLALLLSPCAHTPDTSRPLYHTRAFPFDRLATIGDIQSLCVRDGQAVVEWKEVYIAIWSPLQQARLKPHPTLSINTMLSPPFRVSDASVGNVYGCGYRMHTVSPTSPTWTGTPHFAVVFRLWGVDRFMAMLLGRCVDSHSENAYDGEGPTAGPQPGAHWASIVFYTSRDHASGPEFAGHVCPDDHICLWPDSKRRVGDPHMTNTRRSLDWLLSFTPCGINPDVTLVANLEYVAAHRNTAHAESAYQQLMGNIL